MRVVKAAFLGVALAFLALPSAGVSAAGPLPLDGELLLSLSGTNDYSSCVFDSGQVISFGVASGVVTDDSPATAPYPGTFSISGSATLNPTTNRVTALSGTFSIYNVDYDISGTIALNGSVGSYAACDSSGAYLAYEATIQDKGSSASCSDEGTAYIDTNDAGYLALYSFDSTSLTCSSPPQAQDLLDETSQELANLQVTEVASLTKAQQAKIAAAHETLAQVAASTAWVNDSTLDRRAGGAVLDSIVQVMAYISAASKNASPEVDDALLDAAVQIKDSTALVVTTSLQNGLGLMSQPTYSPRAVAEGEFHLDKAEDLMNQAAAKFVSTENWMVSVTKLMQKAWAESAKGTWILEAATCADPDACEATTPRAELVETSQNLADTLAQAASKKQAKQIADAMAQLDKAGWNVLAWIDNGSLDAKAGDKSFDAMKAGLTKIGEARQGASPTLFDALTAAGIQVSESTTAVVQAELERASDLLAGATAKDVAKAAPHLANAEQLLDQVNLLSAGSEDYMKTVATLLQQAWNESGAASKILSHPG